MLIYVDEVMQEIDGLLEYAQLVREKFEQNRDASELLLDAKTIKRRIDDLSTLMPLPGMTGSAPRHVKFMILHLERGRVDECRCDIEALCDYDLPGAIKAIREWANKLAYVDADLRLAISPLLRTRQFDSAIRKAFVVLKSRLCDKFGIDAKLDGADLVNAIFGAKSSHLTNLNSNVKSAYRDLFAGLFGVMRNPVAHNDIAPDLADLDAVVANVNLCLRIVDDFRTEPTPITR